MDPFHQRLARVALDAAARYGFCLAGGYAVQAHGFVDRVSKDVDLFTTAWAVLADPTRTACGWCAGRPGATFWSIRPAWTFRSSETTLYRAGTSAQVRRLGEVPRAWRL